MAYMGTRSTLEWQKKCALNRKSVCKHVWQHRAEKRKTGRGKIKSIGEGEWKAAVMFKTAVFRRAGHLRLFFVADDL